jgi:hypothetical protein
MNADKFILGASSDIMLAFFGALKQSLPILISRSTLISIDLNDSEIREYSSKLLEIIKQQ